MEKMIIALTVIAIAAVVMLIKRPGSALGYMYCVGVGLALALRFLYPFTSETYEVLHCLTLGAGVGAVFGLAYAAALHGSEYNMGVILGGAILLPILMFVVGFILIVALGLFAMIQNGDGNLVLGSALVMWGFIAALIGGGGSIILIIFDN